MSTAHETPRVTINDCEVEVLKTLGAGGTKTVLLVCLQGLKKALAIPNRTDPESVRRKKWQSAVSEVDSARLLRRLGLLTADYELKDVVVDGVALKMGGLLMTPFSDLPFEVFDGKDGSKTWQQSPLSDVDHFSEIGDRLAGVKDDIVKLAAAGVLLNPDSISFARMPDGAVRLFLYDLAGMSVVDGVDEPNELATRYAELIVHRQLDNLLTFEQVQRFDAQGFDLTERQQLAAALVRDLPAQPKLS